MPTVVATRFRPRPRHLVPFVLASARTGLQARRTPGYLGGVFRIEPNGTFWTVTRWATGRSMAGFRDTGAHRDVVPRTSRWASEAAARAWSTDEDEPPTWSEVGRRITQAPRLYEVERPSADHRAGRVRPPGPGPTLSLPPSRGAVSAAAPGA